MAANHWTNAHRGLVVGALFLTLILIFYFLEYRDKRRQPKQGAGTPQNIPNPKWTINTQQHPSKGQHRAKQQAHWDWQIETENGRNRVARFTLGLTCIAVVATGLTYWQTQRQANSAQGQLQAALDEQRAWIKPKVSISGNWTEIPGVGYSLPVSIINDNIGHQPARNISSDVRAFFFTRKNSDVFAAQRTLCEQLKTGVIINPHYGSFLFPDEVSDPAQKIGGNVLLFDSKRDKDAVSVQTYGIVISMVVYGCVIYRYGPSKEFHSSGFFYNVGNVVMGDDGINRMTISLPVDKGVAKENIRLLEFPSSTGDNY